MWYQTGTFSIFSRNTNNKIQSTYTLFSQNIRATSGKESVQFKNKS